MPLGVQTNSLEVMWIHFYTGMLALTVLGVGTFSILKLKACFYDTLY